jgi:hypothetical protein
MRSSAPSLSMSRARVGPPHELLKPTLVPLDASYAAEFEGMTNVPVPLAALVETRTRLIADVKAQLDEPARKFLLSLHDAEPDFGLIALPKAAELPAVRWKLQNLERLKRDNPAKHAELRTAIEQVWAEAQH